MARILLTGRPGCGKTTAVRETVERLGPAIEVAGFYTEELRRAGRRIGFDVVTVDGRRGPLARAGAPGPPVGRYGVDLESFDRVGVAELEAGLSAGADLLVVDEIGKMELLSDRFVSALERLFDPAEDHVVLGTILRGRHPKADWLRSQSGVEIIEVTEANRDALPRRLAERIGPATSDAGGS
ncbi:MAG: NTPase [Gemmatimonadetes bacterium]|uniref:NTPase n=1 Tax=Candidatus Kutchimonas denitrificans TaxID=3056748 RepID=A0AAE4Z7M2_9BACT|nr:NTPase [Gemmatimonadota bacterium]NIR74187.1 NTPase [Candidatus Kutchimonas denitrificans]NIR99809.1 NTPase [Gemmatimonadota bacterium]NIT65398.1 NTPase [Gemmatimonadota bacterium]NIU51764.1 NTPase [Gemmatimonadota bacterium]